MYRPASARPQAWRNWVPVQEDLFRMLSFTLPQWAGICRPWEALSPVLPFAWHNIS